MNIIKKISVLSVIVIAIIAGFVAGCQNEEVEIPDIAQKSIVTEKWIQSIFEKPLTSVIYITTENGIQYYEYKPIKQSIPRLKSGNESGDDEIIILGVAVTAQDLMDLIYIFELSYGDDYQLILESVVGPDGKPTGSVIVSCKKIT